MQNARVMLCRRHMRRLQQPAHLRPHARLRQTAAGLAPAGSMLQLAAAALWQAAALLRRHAPPGSALLKVKLTTPQSLSYLLCCDQAALPVHHSCWLAWCRVPMRGGGQHGVVRQRAGPSSSG
jgi:hypothetical protein